MSKPRQPVLCETPAAVVEWRRARGLSQPDLAELLGVGERSVQRWETGEARVPPLLSWALLGLAPVLAAEENYSAREERREQKRSAKRWADFQAEQAVRRVEKAQGAQVAARAAAGPAAPTYRDPLDSLERPPEPKSPVELEREALLARLRVEQEARLRRDERRSAEFPLRTAAERREELKAELEERAESICRGAQRSYDPFGR